MEDRHKNAAILDRNERRDDNDANSNAPIKVLTPVFDVSAVRNAIILSEIIGPPVAKRQNRKNS